MDHQEWEIDNLPNRLTIFRVLLIPFIVGSLFILTFENEWAKEWNKFLGYTAAWTFVAASITDFFDGYIARKRGIVTVFGSFLDPVADKFLVISSLVLLENLNRIPVLVVLILIMRELYITSLRLLAMERGLSVPVGQMGKWKTATQMVAIPLLMANDTPWSWFNMTLVGTVCIYLASVFSVYSAVEYSAGLFVKLKQKRKEAREARKNLKEKIVNE